MKGELAGLAKLKVSMEALARKYRRLTDCRLKLKLFDEGIGPDSESALERGRELTRIEFSGLLQGSEAAIMVEATTVAGSYRCHG